MPEPGISPVLGTGCKGKSLQNILDRATLPDYGMDSFRILEIP